jgi:hypothetical protein
LENRYHAIYELETQNEDHIVIEARQHLNNYKEVEHNALSSQKNNLRFSIFTPDNTNRLIEIIKEALLNISNNSCQRLSTYISGKLNKLHRFTKISVIVYVNENNRPSESIIDKTRNFIIIQYGRIEFMFICNRDY